MHERGQINEYFSGLLSEWMKRTKTSAANLAKSLEISKAAIYNYKNGRVPETSILVDLAQLMETTPEALLTPESGPPKVTKPGPDQTDDGFGLTPEKIRATTAATGGGPASVVPPYLSDLTLALRFFAAWATSQAIKDESKAAIIEAGLRRLQSEIEHGRLVALKQEAIAEPEAWGEHLRALVTVLPAEVQNDLMEWLAEHSSAGGAVRAQRPGRRKVDGAG